MQPRHPELWTSTANPVRSYALLNHESPEFIRFVNPGDFRIAHISCGTAGCHAQEVQTNRKQIMSTGCMLGGAALYNNGSVPFKKARFGEAYGTNGAPLRLVSVPAPTEFESRRRPRLRTSSGVWTGRTGWTTIRSPAMWSGAMS